MFDIKMLNSSRSSMFIEITLFHCRSDIFPTFGSKPCLTRLSSAKNKNSQVAEKSPSAGIL